MQATDTAQKIAPLFKNQAHTFLSSTKAILPGDAVSFNPPLARDVGVCKTFNYLECWNTKLMIRKAIILTVRLLFYLSGNKIYYYTGK